MSPTVAVASRLLFVRMLRADTILFVPAGFGIDSTDIRSAWVASFLLRRVLLRLTIVDVSGFRCDPPVTVSVSSEMVLNSDPIAAEGGAPCDPVAKDSTEAMVESRLPREGKARCTESGRGRNASCSYSMADESTDDEGAVEATSDSFASSYGSSSIDVVSRSGEDMDRLLVGECWLRFAPLRFKVGVGERETSVASSVEVVTVEAVTSVVSSDTMVLGGSSTILVSTCIS
jgi:hypothetical protein